jgi:hypothetical protein
MCAGESQLCKHIETQRHCSIIAEDEAWTLPDMRCTIEGERDFPTSHSDPLN